MTKKIFYALECILWESPMWMFFIAGLVILAGTLLVGPYLENRGLTWQRDLIHLQAQRLSEQEQSYRMMLTSLNDHDPVLLQRLAFHYLHLKPLNVNLLQDRRVQRSHIKTAADSLLAIQPVGERISTVDTWLYRPMPVVGVDFPAYTRVDHVVVRATTGPLRLTAVVLGGACVLLGFIPLKQIVHRPKHTPVSFSQLQSAATTTAFLPPAPADDAARIDTQQPVQVVAPPLPPNV